MMDESLMWSFIYGGLMDGGWGLLGVDGVLIQSECVFNRGWMWGLLRVDGVY